MAAGDVEVSIATPEAYNCLLFDGTDDVINISTTKNLNITKGITVSAWVKMTDLTGINRCVIVKRNANLPSPWGFGVNSDNKVWFNYYNGTLWFDSGYGTITDKKWHHIATTRNDDGTTVSFYLDGEVAGTKAGNGVAQDNTLPVSIGINHNGVTYIHAYIRDIKVFDTELASTQITDLMNGKSIEKNLVGHWKLNGNATDSSVNGNNGTITGATAQTIEEPTQTAVENLRVNSSDRYFAIDVNGGSQIVTGRIQEA